MRRTVLLAVSSAVYSLFAIDIDESLVAFDRHGAENIVYSLDDFARDDYYIPIPVYYHEKEQAITYEIREYNPVGLYYRDKQQLVLWEYSYPWDGGKVIAKTKYTVSGVTHEDLEFFFQKIRSFEGFEDVNQGHIFVKNSRYQEKPFFFANDRDQRIVVYPSNYVRYICSYNELEIQAHQICVQKKNRMIYISCANKILSSLRQTLSGEKNNPMERLRLMRNISLLTMMSCCFFLYTMQFI